jgi:hypothetical protein
MAAGQLTLALAGDVPNAVAPRVHGGTGDALSVITLHRGVSFWFPGRRVPLVTHHTRIRGQVGQIAAANPLVALLHGVSWPVTFAGATVTAWTVVLLWPGHAPLWLLVLLVLVLATNGPGSMIAFDFARTENPAERIGRATGVVNVGGFLASLLTILGIGAVLDVLAQGGAYTLGDFKAAFAVQYVFWALGMIGVVRHRRRVRARLARGGVVIAPLHVAVLARMRGRSAYPLVSR